MTAVIMYHYVRPIKNSKYPAIKGKELKDFECQIDSLIRDRKIITMEEFIEATSKGQRLNDNTALLTFDDGYLDHFDFVFPILKRKGIQGSFYIPTKAIFDRKALDVNKIHYILASEDNTDRLVSILESILDRVEFPKAKLEALKSKYLTPNRFDNANVNYFKRMLQVGLPEDMREKICNEIFFEIINLNEEEFSNSLYMTPEQINKMANEGMHIGCHGHDHRWLASLDKETQLVDTVKCREHMNSIAPQEDHKWTFCYPYGNSNEDSIEVLRKLNCAAAFTTIPEPIAWNKNPNHLTLPRLDTNDFN